MILFIPGLLMPSVVGGATVTLMSGNGNVGGTDSQITFLLGPQVGDFGYVFGPADFAAAQEGPSAYIVTPNPLWIPSLPVDPSAKWIGSNADAGLGNGNTALYAMRFDIPDTFASATLTLDYAADDGIGEAAGGGSSFNTGLYIDGTPVCGTSFILGFGAQSVVSCDVSSALTVGTNWLYIEDGNALGPAGLIFSATITTASPEPETFVSTFVGAGVLFGLKVWGRRKRGKKSLAV